MVPGREERRRKRVDVAVVGAGITGLTLCRELIGRGRTVLALEAQDRPGGVIDSRRVEGRLVELGPQRTRLSEPVADLVDGLGLRDELITAPRDAPLYVYREGRLRRVPLDAAGLARTDLLTVAGKLRLLREPLADPPREGESVAEFFRRSFGGEAYLHVLGPLFGGIYASDPERMPAAHSLLPRWRALGAPRSLLLSAARRALLAGEGRPPACSFRRGLSTLTDALRDRCGRRVLLGDGVAALDRRDGRLRLVLESGARVRARRVVLTVPAAEAARLLAGVSGRASRALGRLRYNPLAVVHLVSPLERSGYGYQFSLAEEGFVTRGATWNASLFGRDGVQTAYLGGMGREEEVGRPDRWLGRTAAREFRAVTGAEARPLSVHRTRIPAYDRSWRELEAALESVPDDVRLCASYESQAGIPSRIRRARRLAGTLDRSLEREGSGDDPSRRPPHASRRGGSP